jgi:glycosyltransferase involved in cell wall biosynthesis
MHILFLTDNFPPEVNAPASRTFEHCREWVRLGHKVTVVTCAPNFPRGRVFSGYRNRLWQSEEMAGIRVIRIWTFITRNEGFVLRIADYVSFMLSAFVASFFIRKVDVIIGTSPQFFTACAAYMVALFKRRPWIFELRDIWPESIRVVSAMRHGRLLDLLERLELFLYRRATAIVSVTHAFKANLIGRGIDGDKISVVTNGVDTRHFKPAPKDPPLTAALGLQGKFVAGYIGTHGLAHALDTLVEAARLLASDKDDRFRILMLGDGADRARLKASAEQLGLTNILFIDSVGKADVVRYWSLLDVAVVHLKRDDLFRTVIPSKIFEAMAMGIPILHGVEGESAEIILAEAVGLVFQPENAADLVAQLKAIAQDTALRKRLAAAGPEAASHYDRDVLARRMLAIVSGVA